MTQMRSTGPVPTGTGINPAGVVGLAATAIGIWGLFCAAQLILAAVGFAFSPPLESRIPGLALNIFENALCGLFAGLVIGLLLAGKRTPSKLQESFLSALFNSHLAEPELSVGFWGKVILSGSIGWAVGRMAGATVIIALPPSVSSAAYTVLNTSAVPLMGFIGGGFGGPGGTGFWSLAFLFIVVLILIMFIAVLTSVLLHLVLYGLAGMTKGAVKAYTLALLKSRVEVNGEEQDKIRPVIVGAQRGFIIGVVVGACESIFTTWGVAVFTRSS